MMKSGYPNYPKFRFIRTILVTENRCPKFGYSNTLFLEHFFVIFIIFLPIFLIIMFLIIFTIFLNNIFFIFGKFWTIKRVQKSKKDNSQKKDENDEENDENLWTNEASKLLGFCNRNFFIRLRKFNSVLDCYLLKIVSYFLH